VETGAEEDMINEHENLDNNEGQLLNPPVVETSMVDSRTIVFAPGEKNTPLGLMSDPFAENMSFIRLYGGALVDKPKGMSYQTWCKYRLSSYDRRFAKDPVMLFYMASKVAVDKMASHISVCLRKKQCNLDDMNAKNLTNQEFIDRLVNVDDSGFPLLACDRSSLEFWVN